MQQLLLHSLVVSPLIRWIASPHRRWPRKTGVRISALCLLVLALLQVRRVDLNCYDLLQVDPGASSLEISRSYRKQSAMFHPDRQEEVLLPHGYESKNDIFIELQKCQETLTNPSKLDFYNRFGRLDQSLKRESSLLAMMGVFSFIGYLINFIVCTIFTASDESKRGRYWVNSYMLFTFSTEVFMKYLGQKDVFFFVPYFSTRLVFEQVEILKDLIPSVLSSAMLLCQITHVDDTEMIYQVMKSVSDSNRDIAAHIMSKRKGTDLPILPAVLKMMGAPVVTQPSGAQPSGTPPTEGSEEKRAEPEPSGISMQKIFNYLFYAYVIKVIVSGIRSML